MLTAFILIYILPLAAIFAFYLYCQNKRDKESRAILEKHAVAGCVAPISLHPAIDPAKCMGCASCVRACPEKNVLGIINRQAALITPSKCIGHGACRTACPFGALTLVFGTEKCGVDIPCVRPNFETNVPGIFIAGELGGMGLVRNAIEQGRQAMEAICAMVKNKEKKEDIYDVAVVGAGPAGFSASLLALERGLKFITLEQETLGGTVAHYPRGKIVMTRPVVLPMFGKTKFKETTKEELLKFWQEIEAKTNIKINYSENVAKVNRENSHFTVTTQKNTYKALSILLAIGRRGTPRKLGVPGEEKTKVVYRLVDATQYESKHVLVVGGGNSALEAALALAETKGAVATLSCLTEGFCGVKQENVEKVQAMQKEGKLNVMMSSKVLEIGDQDVSLEQAGKKASLKNDAVIVCAGGILPVIFLKEIGIEVEKKYGKA